MLPRNRRNTSFKSQAVQIRSSRGPFRLSVALILRKYLMFKGLDPKINIPHRKTNFSEKHTSIDISFETVLFGFIDSSWGDLTLEQCCILS